MTNHSQQIVQKLWNYCNVLRDDGLSYGDYVEQLTLPAVPQDGARADAAAVAAGRRSIPAGYDWPSLHGKRRRRRWRSHYRHILEELGKQAGHARR